MNPNPLPSSFKIQPRRSPEPARAWVVVIIALAGLGLMAIVVLAWHKVNGGSQKDLTNPAVEAAPVSTSPKTGEVALAQKAARSRSVWVSTGSGPETVSPIAPEPPPDPGQLVKSLAEVRPATLTPETAEVWHENFLKLVDQGTAAVPALAKFFKKYEDVRFDSGPGPNLLGEPSLRIAFLKLLFDIPGPANVDLQVEVLKTATEPDEIALIARQLEQQEPGKYEGVISEAAKEALALAQKGGLPGRNTRPLFELLVKSQGRPGQ
jgi:hypothetical protein